MSRYSVYINPPDYIAQWLRAEYWNEQTCRVEFPRGSSPRAVLMSVIRRRPKSIPVDVPEGIRVEVPTVRGLNPDVYNYITADGRAAIIGACKQLFRAMLTAELGCLFDHDIPITDVIYNFIDKHGIERTEKNWETVRQMYARLRKKDQETRR